MAFLSGRRHCIGHADHGGRGPESLERQGFDQPGGDDLGVGGEPFQIDVEQGVVALLGMLRQRLDPRDRRRVGSKPGIGALQGAEAPHEETGGDQKHNSASHLTNDHRAPHAGSSGDTSGPLAAEREKAISACGLRGGRQPQRETGQHRETQCEDHDGGVQTHAPYQLRLAEEQLCVREDPRRKKRNDHGQTSAEQSHHGGLDKPATDDSASPRPKGDQDSSLGPTPLGPGQQETGQVYAGDKERKYGGHDHQGYHGPQDGIQGLAEEGDHGARYPDLRDMVIVAVGRTEGVCDAVHQSRRFRSCRVCRGVEPSP